MSLITIEGVTVTYGGVTALKNVSLDVNAGEIVTIVGPNGSGKTSLLKAIIGAVTPLEGSVRIKQGLKIGYVPQDIYLLDDTINSNIAFGELPENFNEKNFKEAIKFAQLENFINTLPDKDKRVLISAPLKSN